MARNRSKRLAFLLVTLLLLNATLPVLAAGAFDDLKGHWVEEKVNDLVAAGIISSGDNFRPRDPVTRADFIKMLVLATGLPEAVSYPPTFSDVRQEHWFYRYVETAAYHGVAKGDDTGKFRPFEGLTREQMASMVIRALKDETDAGSSFLARFKDGGQVSAWAKQDVARTVAKGYISGTDQGFLFPTQAATRDQAAAVIWQVWKKQGGQEPTPTQPPVTGTLSATASSTNLNTVTITFSGPVNQSSAAQVARYRLVPATGLQVNVPIEAVQVATDGQSVTLSTGLLASGARYLLSILDLEAGEKTHTLSLYFTAGEK
ncbi:MAG: S-layer homology domain-containing protein, partial [bacterium]